MNTPGKGLFGRMFGSSKSDDPASPASPATPPATPPVTPPSPGRQRDLSKPRNPPSVPAPIDDPVAAMAADLSPALDALEQPLDEAVRAVLDLAIDATQFHYERQERIPTYRAEYVMARLKDPISALKPEPRAQLIRLCTQILQRVVPHEDRSIVKNRKVDRRSPEYIRLNFKRNFYTGFTFGLFCFAIVKKAKLTPADIATLLESLDKVDSHLRDDFKIGRIVQQLGWGIKAHPPSDEDTARLRAIAEGELFGGSSSRYGSDMEKAQNRLLSLIQPEGDVDAPLPPAADIKPTLDLGSAPIELAVSASFEAGDAPARLALNRLFQIAVVKFGKAPNKKLSAQLADIRRDMPQIDEKALNWFRAAVAPDAYLTPGLGGRNWQPDNVPSTTMQSLLKSVVWAVKDSDAPALTPTLQALGAHSFETVPGHGPRAKSLGNAVIAVLATRGLPGLAALSAVRLKVRQPSIRKSIDTVIAKEAEALGVTPNRLQEMAVPTLGLAMGRREWEMDGYTLTLDASQPGKAPLTWTKPDGSAMKSVPAAVKQSEAHSATLKAARALAKEAKSALSVQKDRIDQLFVQDPRWSADDHREAYLDHALIGPMSRTLIWTVDGTPALYRDEAWEDIAGQPIGSAKEIGLWHPIQSETDDIMAWRARLEALNITQPFKQAHREVYLLTDAEVNTRVYSNRMAAHILKQHQFRALAVGRGWAYSLMGAYDDGRDNEIALRPLPTHSLRAEFWIDEMHDDHDAFNDAGIWDYVATDQIRFVNTATDQPMPVSDVPPLVFSEIMRDCDLFVGVTSVGNDPNWLDAGGTRTDAARQYWQSYAFGDLSELAKTRKALLTSLLPRLKIASKTAINGNFLEVQGTRHRYRIHIGSTNIQILPDNRYLCIVPGRGSRGSSDGFLPFEGDRGLSIVLSKAFMLVDDDKITDPTILSQIGG